MFITLEEAKKHLNIDSDFTEDDTYITNLINVAEIAVFKHIDDNDVIETEEDGEGNETQTIPSPLKQAMLLLIGTMYANREPVSYTSTSEVPLSYNYLLSLFKHY